MTKPELSKYLDRSDITIENNTARWDINVNGDINGLYTGTFVFRCFLTPIQKLACGREYRELLGSNPLNASEHEDTIAFTLTQLKYRVISSPPFWSSSLSPGGYSDLPDEKVLDAILEAAVASELKFTGLLQEKREKALERAKKAAEKVVEDKKSDIIEKDAENV